MAFSEYNWDQLTALTQVRDFFRSLPLSRKDEIQKLIQPYLGFRAEVKAFQDEYLSDICTVKCFQEMQSACCNREGIATFFADFVVNIIYSDEALLDMMEEQLMKGAAGNKCVYLTNQGCLWFYKPVVCEMFLCDHAKKSLGEKGASYRSEWDDLREKEKIYTWPDKPVLFDELETIFITDGIENPLMYFHKSPGLMRIKSRWKEAKKLKKEQHFA